MSTAQGILLITGCAIQLIGLTLSGLGLAYTWSQSAGGHKALPALVGQIRDLWRWIRRKPRRITVERSTWWLPAMEGRLYGAVDFPPDLTLEQKVDYLKTEVDTIGRAASEAHSRVERVARELDGHRTAMSKQLSQLREELDESIRRNVLDGLPIAGLGLAIVGIGLTVQTVASFL